MNNVIESFNIFLDSDRGDANTSSTGTDYDVVFNPVNINVDKGQQLRLSLVNFNMFKQFTNIHNDNNKFNLKRTSTITNNQANTELTLDHKNYKNVYDLIVDFAEKIKTTLGATGTTTIVSPLPNSSATNDSNMIQFTIDFGAAHNLTDVKLQFFERFANSGISDAYSLFGGKRIRDTFDAGNNNNANSYQVDSLTDPNKITFTSFYPGQRFSEHFVYLRSSLNSKTLESSSLNDANGVRGNVSDVHHSNIVARIPIDNEFIHYEAPYEGEYFINLPNMKHLNNVRFFLTNCHGTPLKQLNNMPDQDTVGNLNFSMVLRLDIIQKSAPNESFTEDIPRTSLARFSNIHNKYDGFNR